jgi:predicted kinase
MTLWYNQLMQKKRPILILISGAPGSGKSTLARKLTEYIQFLYLDADAVLQNFWLNNIDNKGYNRETVGTSMLYDVAAQLGLKGISVIMDTAASDETLRAKLSETFDIRQIHCEASNPSERFYQRELNENGEEPEWLSSHMNELKEKREVDSLAPNFGLPIIKVITDSEYVPNILTVIERLNIDDEFKIWSKRIL